MPSVTIKPSGKIVESAEGSSLLEVILASGEPIAPRCDGNALCGNCHIFVHDGRKGISRIQAAENEKLDTLVGIGSKSRLACQARLGTENVTVELLGFASGL